jgi:integrase/recombinase XerC
MPSLETIFAEWLEHLKKRRGYAAHTLTAYAGDLNHFFTFLQEYAGEPPSLKTLQDLPLSAFRAWLAARMQEDKNAATNARAVSSLRTFYRYLLKEHAVENTAALTLRAPKRQAPIPKASLPNLQFELRAFSPRKERIAAFSLYPGGEKPSRR